MNDEQLLLYSRQVLMPNIGVEGQEKLLDSTVLIVGAGGLGCTVAQYLVGSGIGRLIVVDDDIIELSNLPRQVLFSRADIGQAKAEVLCEVLNRRLEKNVCQAVVEKFNYLLVKKIVQEIGVDNLLLVDAGDNLELSYQLDEAAEKFHLPLVHASVSRGEGYLYTRLPQSDFLSLQTVFSQHSTTESCSQNGVMTVAVGLIGVYQAMQVIRVILRPHLGEIVPELVLFDGMAMRFMALRLEAKSKV